MDDLHPLLGPELRVERAGEHIQGLRKHLEAWADAHTESFGFAEIEPGRVGPVQHRELPKRMVAEAAVFIGDALFNLRAALDYLVYIIAGLCEGREVHGTQFPIEDSMDMFDARITGKHPVTGKPVSQYLRGVPPVVVERIRQLQPCSGCLWTATLRDLSNPDKHRHLSALRSQSWFKGTQQRVGDTLNIEGHVEVEVSFGSTGGETVDTLELLHQAVGLLIQEFKPGFQTRGEEDVI